MELISELARLLLLAALLGLLMARIGQPPLLGYLLAGIIAGSTRLGTPAQAGTIQSLGDLGVILLLFYLGLELSWRKMAPIAGRSLAITVAVMALPFLLIFNLLLLWGMGPGTAALVALGLAVTGTAIGVQALEVHGALSSRVGHLLIGVNLLTDLTAILALAAIGAQAEGDASFGTVLLRMTGFTVVCVTVGVVLVPRFLDLVHARVASRILLPVTLIALGLGIAYVGHVFGVPLSVGAFLAGALAAEARCRDDLEGYLHPVKEMFIAFFFVAIGFQIRLESFPHVALAAVGLSILIVAVRGVAVSTTAFVLGEDGETSLGLAATLLPISELALLLLTSARLEPALRENLLAMVCLMMFLVALVVEPGLRHVPAIQRRLAARAPGAIRHLLVIVRGVLAPAVSPFPPPGNPVRGAFKDFFLTLTVIAGVGIGIAETAAYLDDITPSWLSFRLLGAVVGVVFFLPAMLIARGRWLRLLELMVGKYKTGPGTERIRLIQRATRAALTAIIWGILGLIILPFFHTLVGGQRVALLVVLGVAAVALAFVFRNAVVRLHDLLAAGMTGRGPGAGSGRDSV